MKLFFPFVDTGASGFAFISESMSKNLKLPYHLLPSPIQLTGYEGKEGPLVTHEVIFPLYIVRNFEILKAYITNPCKHDLMLGLPWLEKHNPYINWENNYITFGGKV